MAENRCTSGDTDEASARLRRLAELSESETGDLLLRDAARTTGFDASARYIDKARRNHGTKLGRYPR